MKMSWPLRYPRALLLGAANCLLLGFLTQQLLQPVQLPPLPKSKTADPVAGQSIPALGNTDVANAEDLYGALTAQPLFHQDRQLVPEKPVDSVPQTPPPAYVLTGYLGLPGRPGRAFLQPVAGGRTLIVGLGESVEGWTVVGVAAKRVELKQGDRTFGIGKDGSSAVTAATPDTALAPTPATASSPTPQQAGVAGTGSVPAAAPLPPSSPAPAKGATNLIARPTYPLPAVSGNGVHRGPAPPVAVAPQSPPHTYSAPPAPKSK